MTWDEAHKIVNKAEKEVDLLEKKINSLIKEWTDKYPEPYFVITEGKEYKIRLNAFTSVLMEQPQNYL